MDNVIDLRPLLAREVFSGEDLDFKILDQGVLTKPEAREEYNFTRRSAGIELQTVIALLGDAADSLIKAIEILEQS